ncbi:MAG: transglycosylase domain-containing protein [Bacteroidales bacterium]|nr:transglycosylase domain-containing protein [Bacteroidales bacterium]
MLRKIKIVVISSLFLFLLLVIGVYALRNTLLNCYVSGKTQSLSASFGLAIHYEKLAMNGVRTIQLNGLTVVPQQRDTLLQLHQLEVKLDFWSLLGLHINVSEVNADGLNVSFVKGDSLSNYDFLFKAKKENTDILEEENESDFSDRAERMLHLAFGFLPSNGEMKGIRVTHTKGDTVTAIGMDSLIVSNNIFNGTVTVTEKQVSGRWTISGTIDNKEKNVMMKICSATNGKVQLPYIGNYYNAGISFDTLAFSLAESRKDELLHLQGKAEVSGLSVFHQTLSPDTIDLNEARFNYLVHISKEYIELDSATTVLCNKLKFNPYIRAERKGKWHLTASVNKPMFNSQELFSSLPGGLFSNLDGIRSEGRLGYHFFFDVDMNKVDSLRLESEVTTDHFRIRQYGAVDLRKMNAPFIYTAYEQGEPVRSFEVGPGNPGFVPLDSISPLLQMSVLQSEDGEFFWHRGFRLDAMREALIHDLKVKRFARGGSTITMQLVKNVFLNRKKNIARKVEESILVWLIENGGLTTKDRMFEVYLNIAEWGPNVYGAKEASEFYFAKQPSELSVEEAIFMASIIPKPKRFRGSFTPDMRLRESLSGYYRLLAQRLAIKGLISEEEAAAINPQVVLRGRATETFLQPTDTVLMPLSDISFPLTSDTLQTKAIAPK